MQPEKKKTDMRRVKLNPRQTLVLEQRESKRLESSILGFGGRGKSACVETCPLERSCQKALARATNSKKISQEGFGERSEEVMQEATPYEIRTKTTTKKVKGTAFARWVSPYGSHSPRLKRKFNFPPKRRTPTFQPFKRTQAKFFSLLAFPRQFRFLPHSPASGADKKKGVLRG